MMVVTLIYLPTQKLLSDLLCPGQQGYTGVNKTVLALRKHALSWKKVDNGQMDAYLLVSSVKCYEESAAGRGE